MPQDLKIDCIELPATDLDAVQAFCAGVFGWTFEDHGDDYRAPVPFYGPRRQRAGGVVRDLSRSPGRGPGQAPANQQSGSRSASASPSLRGAT